MCHVFVAPGIYRRRWEEGLDVDKHAWLIVICDVSCRLQYVAGKLGEYFWWLHRICYLPDHAWAAKNCVDMTVYY